MNICTLSVATRRLMLLMALIIGFILSLSGPAWSAQQVVITGTTVNLRAGPGANHEAVASASQGNSFDLLGQSGDWYKVELSGGKVGWVAGWLAKVESTTSADNATGTTPSSAASPAVTIKKAVIDSSAINVRSGPGTSTGIVGQVKQGEKYDIIGNSGDWLKIELSNGATGWIAAWLVRVENVTSSPLAHQDSGTPAVNQTGNVAVVSGNMVNIRIGPGTNYDVVAQVNSGDELSLLGQSGDWYKVNLNGGTPGWIVASLVKVDKPDNNVQNPPDVVVPPVVPPAGGGQTPVNQNPGSGDNPSRSGNYDMPDDWIPPGQQCPDDIATPVNVGLLELDCTEEDEITEIVLRADGDIKFNIFKLSGPDRLVVDIEGANPGALDEVYQLDTGAISQVRTGLFNQEQQEYTRIVAELKGAVGYRSKLSDDLRTLTLEVFIPSFGKSLPGRTIVIDPGHGGSDPGAIGKSGLREKDVNLDVSRRVAKLLADKGANVIMTRNDDSYVDLYERTRIANEARADVFVSIHMNANLSSVHSGTSTYYQRVVIPGDEWRLDASKVLASHLQSNMVKTIGRKDIGILQANFAVLRTAEMPAALAEVAFLSNPEEENLMKGETFRVQAAESIARGISDFFALSGQY